MVRSQQTLNTGEMSFQERQHHLMQVVFSRKMHERRVFLDELNEIRRKKEKETMKYIIKLIGPKWYHTLSVFQRESLDSLQYSMSKDLVEGIPVRTLNIMKALGLYPRPNKIDLMNCVYLGRDDPKEMLAQLYLCTYGYEFDLIESDYCLNAKLILSAIYYLGLNSLIQLLTERFKPEPKPKPTESVVKRRSKVNIKHAISPYLEHMTASYYEPLKKKRFHPAPLPSLDDLNEPWEPKPRKPKLPPPPPPPPPPKKRLPQSYCEKLAGMITIEPYSSPGTTAKYNSQRRNRAGVQNRKRDKMYLIPDEKKVYGVGMTGITAKRPRIVKPVAPITVIANNQFLISGVFRINGKSVYVLGNITELPPVGDLLHRGHKCIEGENIIIHGGYQAYEVEPEPSPCDCLKQWTGTVLKYVRRTKCYCGHNYDYGNEGHFPNDELAFFQKPTEYAPSQFNLETIFNMDPKSNYVQKQFNNLWKTDSILNNGQVGPIRKSIRRTSKTCLGENPKPEDYLRCSLRYMEDVNLAAKLPDIHLAPELKEWMHRRIYGPYSPAEKKALIRKSGRLWKVLELYTKRGLGKVRMPKEPAFRGETNWTHKQALSVKFREYTKLYRTKLYQAQANVTNMFWPTMFQDKFPDKHFREVFFSYVFTKIDDVQLMHPFSMSEALSKYQELLGKRYCCVSHDNDTESLF